MEKLTPPDEPILGTVTGENFQPVRLHYRVLDRKGLLKAFKKLRCVDRDPTQERWVWLYDHEARGLPFKQPYAQLPPHLRPVIIGSFFLRPEAKLLLDLRSCERAVHAVEFFDRHLPRKVARVEEAEVVNKLFPAAGNMKLTPDQLFDHQPSTFTDPDAAVQRIRDLVAGVPDPEEKFRLALEDLEAQAKKPLPEVERFPVHFYEDGIQGFVSALQMRQIVALQHWLGNTDYSLYDVIQTVTKSR